MKVTVVREHVPRVPVRSEHDVPSPYGAASPAVDVPESVGLRKRNDRRPRVELAPRGSGLEGESEKRGRGAVWVPASSEALVHFDSCRDAADLVYCISVLPDGVLRAQHDGGLHP